MGEGLADFGKKIDHKLSIVGVIGQLNLVMVKLTMGSEMK